MSKIIISELTSVKDNSTPTSTEDIINIAKLITTKFPNGIQLENIIESTMIILKK